MNAFGGGTDVDCLSLFLTGSPSRGNRIVFEPYERMIKGGIDFQHNTPTAQVL
jgi:hypothetical protein